MTEPTAPAELLALARPLAERVAERLRSSLAGAGPTVTTKSTATDLVTELDTWAEGHIVERLLAARPQDTIVGEEGASVTGTSEVTWSIDPIDGTVNFVHALPGFCVSIAALVEGRSVAGVVASPMHGEVFTATAGGGAHLNDAPIRCAERPALGRAVVGTGFGYDADRRRRQAQVVAAVIGEVADIRRFGAAALDLCWVACGRLDGYWEVGLNPWDHGAGSLIATEAGARCVIEAGAGPSDTYAVAASPVIFDELAALLRHAEAHRV